MNYDFRFTHALGRFRLHSRDGGRFENGWSLRELLVYLAGDTAGEQSALEATKSVGDKTPFGTCPVLFNYAQRLSYHISDNELQSLIPHVPGLLESYSLEKESERASFLLKSMLYLVFVPQLINDGGAKYVEPLLQAIEEGTERTARYLKFLSHYRNMYRALHVCDTLKAAAYKLHQGNYVNTADLVGDAIIQVAKNDPAALNLGFSLLGNAIILGPHGHDKVSKYASKASRMGDMSAKMAWAYPERQTA